MERCDTTIARDLETPATRATFTSTANLVKKVKMRSGFELAGKSTERWRSEELALGFSNCFLPIQVTISMSMRPWIVLSYSSLLPSHDALIDRETGKDIVQIKSTIIQKRVPQTAEGNHVVMVVIQKASQFSSKLFLKKEKYPSSHS